MCRNSGILWCIWKMPCSRRWRSINSFKKYATKWWKYSYINRNCSSICRVFVCLIKLTIFLFQEYWWALVLGLLGLLGFMSIFVKVCSVHTPSSNPRFKPARSFSFTHGVCSTINLSCNEIYCFFLCIVTRTKRSWSFNSSTTCIFIRIDWNWT